MSPEQNITEKSHFARPEVIDQFSDPPMKIVFRLSVLFPLPYRALPLVGNGLKKMVAATLVIFYLFVPGVVQGVYGTSEGPAKLLKSADNCRKSLFRSTGKKKYRDNWLKCIRKYGLIYSRYPVSEQAPWAMFRAAGLLSGLYAYSGRSKDLDRAIHLYQQLLRKYKGHRLADDAHYRLGQIYYKYEKDLIKARGELLEVCKRYPSGDMRPKAESLLNRISGELRRKRKPRNRISIRANKKRIAVKNIRHWSAPNYTRVVIDLDGPVKYSHHLLDADPQHGKPRRIYLDLNNACISPQIGSPVLITGNLVNQVRIGRYKRNTVRVVLDMLDGGSSKVFHLYSPFRIVVDIRGKQKVSTPVCGIRAKTVVIDSGHGGKDPGCTLGKTKEKDINFEIAKYLAKKLKQQADLKVFLTRTRDDFVPLEQRTAFANTKKADLFISLHTNIDKDRKKRGLETYYLNVTTNPDSMMVAARENASTEKGIGELQLILQKLMLNHNIQESKRLAHDVQKAMVSQLSAKHRGVRDLGVKYAPFYVLIGAEMPAILIETGFISNPIDRKHLLSQGYQRDLADGICSGMLYYLSRAKLDCIYH